jgi:uncharacterized protein YgiM (DUF1202 family)
MNRTLLMIAFIFLSGVFLIAAGENAKLTVTVREAQMRTKPSYLGKIVARLKYFDTVIQASDPQNGWIKVSLPSGKSEGWINMSAITEYKQDVKAGRNMAQGASSGDVQAAGKGFNNAIETEYQSEKHLDYTWVNRMERYRVTAEQASAFLKAGGLHDTVGGEE